MPIEQRRVVYITPDDDAEAAVLAAANAATSSLHGLVYAFTDVSLVEIFIQKHQAGLQTGVVVDQTQAHGRTQLPLMRSLIDAGVPLVVSRSPKGGILHQKVLAVDVAALGAAHNASFVCYGSFNLTAGTAEAEANVLVTDNDAAVCAYFMLQYAELEAFGLQHPAWQITGESEPHP